MSGKYRNIFDVSSGLSGREQEKTSAVFEPKLLSREFDRVTDRNNKLRKTYVPYPKIF
jgi:hypothetical protein